MDKLASHILDVSSIKLELDNIARQHQLKLQELDQELKAQISQIEQFRQQQLSSLDSSNLEEFLKLNLTINQLYQSSLEIAIANHKSLSEIEQNSYDRDHALLQKKIDDLNSPKTQQIKSLKEEHAQAIKSLEEKHAQEIKNIQASFENKQLNVLSNSLKSKIDRLALDLQGVAKQHGLAIELFNSQRDLSDYEKAEISFVNFLFIDVFVRSIVNALVKNIADMNKIQRDDLERQSCNCLEQVIKAVCLSLQSNKIDSSLNVIQSVIASLPSKSVVLLIDEYDTPINGTFEFTALCDNIMQCMRTFYNSIKNASNVIKFSFVTGITNYSKVSLFSGANQFYNISYAQDFATIVGFTEDELKRYISPAIYRMALIAKTSPQACLNKIKEYYNGYCFVLDKIQSVDYASVSIMNPISIGRYLVKNNSNFENYWIDMGSNISQYIQSILSTFDFDYLMEIVELANKKQLHVEANAFDNPQVLSIENLKTSLPIFLFQSGYLTLDWTQNLSLGQSKFYFKIPNQEVKNSFSRSILSLYHFSCIDTARLNCFDSAVFNTLFFRRIFLVDVLFSHDEKMIADAMFKFFVEAEGVDARQNTNEAVWRDFLYQAILRDQDLKLLKNLDIEIEREQINGEGLADIVVTHKGLKRRVALELKLNKRGGNIDEIVDNAKAQMISRCYGVGNAYALDCYVCVFILSKSSGTKDNPSLSITCSKVPESDVSDAMIVTNPINTPTLITDRLILRRFDAGELEELLQIHKDPEVNKFCLGSLLKIWMMLRIFITSITQLYTPKIEDTLMRYVQNATITLLAILTLKCQTLTI